MRWMRWMVLLLLIVVTGLVGVTPAGSQFMGVLSTPITVATIERTNNGTEGIVAAQGSGVKIRLLGFFLTVDRMTEVQFQDTSGDACTGRLVLATGETLSVPVQPPGWICETGANERLDVRITNAALSPLDAVVGGVLMWQPSQ